LLRLLFCSNAKPRRGSPASARRLPNTGGRLPPPRLHIQSIIATGGVYKGQGRNQRELMTRAYWEFLVHGQQLQAPIPSTKAVQRFTRPFRARVRPADAFSVARVRPRTSKGITDLFLLNLVWLNTTCPSKKSSADASRVIPPSTRRPERRRDRRARARSENDPLTI